MKNWFFVLALLWSSWAGAAYSVSGGGKTFTVAGLSCATVGPAASAALNIAGYTIGSCSSDPVAIGTNLNWVYGGGPAGAWTITDVRVVCATGTHWDTSTQTCVDDITTAIVSCLPSVRTISPCPSGFAPTNAIPAGSGAPDPYLSKFDSMAVQDLLYAIGVCLFGVLGLGIGVKLT